MDDHELTQVKTDLETSVGQRIDEICSSTLGSNFDQNQCAHYVSHMLGYDFSQSASCKYLTFDDSRNDDVKGATIRVDVIFNKLVSAHRQKLVKNMCYRPGLVFVTQERNIQSTGDMGNTPAKHIGIMIWPWVYHYSNTQNKVKKEDATSFINTFTSAYAGNGPVVFYRGEFIA
ncbi:hypothetical protein [Marinimicrobium sp. C2-29]|uniref:hypothetical protein n=1 Tax=Marinimicrobium sp. C2-29 TaxID=3139825 RepID=UPI003138847B